MRWQSCAADTLTISYFVARQMFRQKKSIQSDDLMALTQSGSREKRTNITISPSCNATKNLLYGESHKYRYGNKKGT
jgi:hypothetical protein